MLCLAVRYNILKLFLKNWFTKWKAKQKNPRELKSKIFYFMKKKVFPFDFRSQIAENETEKQRNNSTRNSNFWTFKWGWETKK